MSGKYNAIPAQVGVQGAPCFLDPVTGEPTATYVTEEGTVVTSVMQPEWSDRRSLPTGQYSERCYLCGTILPEAQMQKIRGRFYCTKFGCAREVSR